MKTIIKELDLLKKAVIIQWNITKKKDLLQTIVCKKLTEKKIPDCRDTKEHYQSLLRKKNTKLVKQSKMITQQPNFWKIQHC